jgi:TRAP-type mannitol/chloroaromatic compound transport system permease small subunit
MEVATTACNPAFLRALACVVRVTGRSVSWLTLLMVVVMFGIVVMRYGFSLSSVAVQESVIYLHSLVFMLAAAWTLSNDGHVRVDIIYGARSKRYRAWVDLLGTCLFLLPLCLFMIVIAWDYVLPSWQLGESSREAGGLPGVYLLKSLILVAPLLLLLQGIVQIGENWVILRQRGSS